jgi:hypothetical protein
MMEGMAPGTAREPRATFADAAIVLAALPVLAAAYIPLPGVPARDPTFVQVGLHLPALALGAIAILRVLVGPPRLGAHVPRAFVRGGAACQVRRWVADQRAGAAGWLAPALALAHTAFAAAVHLVAFLFGAALLTGIVGNHPPPADARTFAEALAAAGYLTMSTAVLWRGMTAPHRLGARTS